MKKNIKFLHEGKYAAEVDVELIEDDSDWSPYLTVDDAYKLDAVREALQHQDIETASSLARVFTLNPVEKP